jgi:hypothetical protein
MLFSSDWKREDSEWYLCHHPIDASRQLGFVHGFGVVKSELGINARVYVASFRGVTAACCA